MSFGNMKAFDGVQGALVLAMMLVSVIAISLIDIPIVYKIGIGILAFTVIFLATLATEMLRQQKEALKRA